jgi:hypothetical protein
MPGRAAFHDQRDKTASHFRSESEELLLALIAQTGIQLQMPWTLGFGRSA